VPECPSRGRRAPLVEQVAHTVNLAPSEIVNELLDQLPCLAVPSLQGRVQQAPHLARDHREFGRHVEGDGRCRFECLDGMGLSDACQGFQDAGSTRLAPEEVAA
jgi:hypothetical protein